MKPKFLKQTNRRTVDRQIKRPKECDRQTVTQTGSVGSLIEKKENEEFDEDFLQELDACENSQSGTLLNQEKCGGTLQTDSKRTHLMTAFGTATNLDPLNDKKCNESLVEHYSGPGKELESSHVGTALHNKKKNRNRRQRRGRRNKSPFENKVSEEDNECDPVLEMTGRGKVCNKIENINHAKKAALPKTTQPRHGIFNDCTTLKDNVPRRQGETLDIGSETENKNYESKTEYVDASSSDRYAKQTDPEPVRINLSRIPSAEIRNQILMEIYKTMVRSRKEVHSLDELSGMFQSIKSFHIIYDNMTDITSLLERNEDKFVITYSEMDEPLFSVKTDMAICAIFTNDTCQSHMCHDLHICKYFLLSKCSIKNCKFGHNLSTDHNRKVYRHYALDGVDKESKLRLLRYIESRNISTMPLMCKFFNNEGGCKKNNNCTHLHLCKNYINNDCKFNKRCKRCHNILAKQPLSVLKRYGLNPNSFNIDKLLSILKDTLENGDVVLKRDIQHNRGVRADRHNSLSSINDVHESSTSDTSSSEMSDSDEDDETDNDWKEQTLESYGFVEQDSSFEQTDGERQGTPENDLSLLHKNEHIADCGERRPFCGHSTSLTGQKKDLPTGNGHQGDTEPIMTFESQIEKKQFVVRKVNGRLVIWNKLGNWYNMNEEDSARLLQLHQNFISFAEKLDDHDV
ncbi:uncharacterized protein LOC132746872 [Ruditapes philippinarum]|uniref:uncharacterized protein LOC132746872 n=1 Tax=Ruditapes philippinarum TaxID=129788 RepID=UPI00295A93E5|nr:uncharacterized protein LOC132746872 [Ruditapes philippinarum]